MQFINLRDDLALCDVIQTTFKQRIEPLYGDQTAAIQKIMSGIDRCCEIFLLRNKPIGFIVYKTSLQYEFGLTDAFELKTAYIFDVFQNQGMGKYLFKRAEALAKSYNAKHIYATVANEMQGLLFYLKNFGWREIHKTKSSDNVINVIAITKDIQDDK